MRHSRPNTAQRLMCGAAAVAILSFAGAAQAEEAKAFSIQPQSLSTALAEFGAQSGHPVMAPMTLLDAKTTRGFSDSAEPTIALAQLLDGTGLTFTRSGDTFAIVRASDPQSGSAAGDGADQGTVQALIVTAQKREEDIQDVPIAISAFTQEDLTRSQVAGGPDLMTQVPNMTFTKTNFNSYSIQIRGIGTQAVSATVDPAVAVAFNNTPFVRNHFFEQEFYDLERVEVLRGPQGTLYGRNATAGVVNIISAKPKFRYEAKLSADVGNYNSQRFEGMINLPLVEDKVALRLAGAWTKRDGYDVNEITGNRIDGRDLWSTRTSLRFTPSDRLDVNLIWEHFEEDDDRLRSGKQLCHKDVVAEVGGQPVSSTALFPGSIKTYQQSQLSQGCLPASLYAPESFETPNGFQFGFYYPISAIGLPIALSGVDPYGVNQSRDLRVVDSTTDPSYRAKNDTVELQFTYDLTDTLSLTSETAWASDFLFSTQDYNRINTPPQMWQQADTVFGGRPDVLKNGVFCDPQIGCSDRLVLVDLIDSKSRDFSEELRLASNFDGPFNFSLGGNFIRYDTEDKYYVFINALTLWASIYFTSGISTPYVPGQSDNRECMQQGMETISLNNRGGVGTAGDCVYIDPNPIGSLNDLGHNYFLSKNPYKLISYAVFGEAYYKIADNLKLTAGLRWTVDKKEAPRIPSWLIAGPGLDYPVLEVVDQEWREPTGRVTLDWKPSLSFTDETLLYASVARGYKAGGANPPPAGIALNVNTGADVPSPSDTHPLTFDPEFVNAIEVGTKNTLLDGRLTLNTTAFYYDYKGYQLSQIVDRSAITKNYDADIWGVEIEADWRPIENLRLGFKGGYENTKVADGMSAVDVMDRSNGNQLDYFKDRNGDLVLDGNGDPIPFHWIVVKPFPTYPSNCIMPDVLWTGGGTLSGVQQVGNVRGAGFSGPCDVSYYQGLDVLTGQPYQTLSFPNGPGQYNMGSGATYPNYPGFFPGSAPNNGEGISKDLSGNELPNAPHFTATVTADYTLPLPQNWLMTLHTDLYYQSEAWTRIFNTPGYDKLKAYTNVNLAAIFTNEDAGWKVMAYVKNVFDRDSITGAFLNSDDSGLTTNVFLTEPRLYGLRVTKDFSGGPWWTGANPNHTPGEPYPFTVELSGQIQRHDAPYETVQPSFIDAFAVQYADTLNTLPVAEHRDLDWGDGRGIKLTYRPAGPWMASAGVRFGRTNGGNSRLHAEQEGAAVCRTSKYPAYCDPSSPSYFPGYLQSPINWSDVTARNREEHTVADFQVGRDLGLGVVGHSILGTGLRYAQFTSTTTIWMNGIPDWYLPVGFGDSAKYAPVPPSTHTRYTADLEASREFEGLGPTITWDAAKQIVGDEDAGHLDVDWSVTGGVLFGKQKTSTIGVEQSGEASGTYNLRGAYSPDNPVLPLTNVVRTPINTRRTNSVTVPVVDLSLGLSYEIQRVKVSTGYRWERYYNVLDAGDTERTQFDRTIDGPYFKIAVGFGG